MSLDVTRELRITIPRPPGAIMNADVESRTNQFHVEHVRMGCHPRSHFFGGGGPRALGGFRLSSTYTRLKKITQII